MPVLRSNLCGVWRVGFSPRGALAPLFGRALRGHCGAEAPRGLICAPTLGHVSVPAGRAECLETTSNQWADAGLRPVNRLKPIRGLKPAPPNQAANPPPRRHGEPCRAGWHPAAGCPTSFCARGAPFYMIPGCHLCFVWFRIATPPVYVLE